MASLEETAKNLVQSALSLKSTKSYNCNLTQFQEFVKNLPSQYQVGPPNPGHITLFIAHLYNSGLSSATISSKLSSLSYYFKLMGWDDHVQDFLVQKALSGVKKLNPSVDTRLPITLSILELLIKNTGHVTPSHQESTMLKSMMSLSFFGLLRPGEVTDSINTLQLNSVKIFPDHLEITFLKHKHSTGPVTIHVSKQQGLICPVQALKAYRVVRKGKPGPLFCYHTGQAIPYKHYQQWFGDLLSLNNIKGCYNLHSFRIGGATLAASRGFSVSQIQAMGRWRSNAFIKYIRMPKVTL